MPENCIFCKIAAGEIPAKKVLDEPDLVAFHDLNAKAPVHVLVIPREHIPNLAAAAPGHEALLGRPKAGPVMASISSIVYLPLASASNVRATP